MNDQTITAYFAAPVRGRLGDAVDSKVKWDNVQKAIRIGWTIRQAFPSLELFIPHEHEIVIDQLWRNGLPSHDIITATAQIAVTKDFAIVYDGDGITEGMTREIDTLTGAGKKIIYFDNLNEETREEIAEVIMSLTYRPKGD